uniref:Cytochrome P450 n=1 Tax=Arcella intermedia TaxID=1963864 RepID=A0A6B2LCW6_9EUKA
MKRSMVPIEAEIDSNLLNFLCYSRNEDGELNPENQVVDECVTFIFAGEDTTASTLSWIMYHLSLNPHIQKIMQEEIDRVLQGNRPTFTNLHSLHYCQNVIKETMRISPVVPILPRMLGKDYIIDGHLVKKGTLIHLFLYGVHVDPKIWKDPKEFNPERWEDSAKSFHWLPFSAGQRNCIGQKFAMQELLIAIAMIFQKFSVVYNDEKKISPVFEGVLIPKNLEIKFIPRLQEEKE